MLKKYQTGATMWTTLSIAFMIGFIVYFAFSVGDIYLDYWKVKGSIKELVNDSLFKTTTKREALSSLQKRLAIDSVRGMDKNAFIIRKDRAGVRYIQLKYSKTTRLFGNISALVEFDEEVRPE